MNFKTTLVLIVLLAVAGVALYFTSNKSAETKGTDTGAPGGGDEQRLFADITTDKVTKLTSRRHPARSSPSRRAAETGISPSR